MISSQNFKAAILAGNAQLTITNPVSGSWIKLKMRRRKDKRTGKPGNCYFLKLALLQDGELGFRYVGAYFSDSGRFKPGNDITYRERTIAGWIINAINRPSMLDRAEIEHCGSCLCCGRKLTTPESIRSGWGPKCFEAEFGDLALRPLAEFGLLDR